VAQGDIHKGDIGTVFEITMYDQAGEIVRLDTATSLKILWERQDRPKTTTQHTAELVTDGTDGKLQYVTTDAADLDYVGKWKQQAYVEMPTGKWSSDFQTFKVIDNLEVTA